MQDTSMLLECNKHDINCVSRENSLLRNRLHQQRQQLGQICCQANGVGPTGGFCLTKEEAVVGGNGQWDSRITAEMQILFQTKSVLDLGCGLGHYGKAFDEGSSVRWTGYDGSENIETVTDDYVHFMDLTSPQWIGKKFDWVMSLDVGEHIPQEAETVFIDNIVRHAIEGVVLSWAVPGQGGHHHVNEQPNDHIIEQMQDRGFVQSSPWTKRLREAAELAYFKSSIVIYEREPKTTSGSSLQAPAIAGAKQAVSIAIIFVCVVGFGKLVSRRVMASLQGLPI